MLIINKKKNISNVFYSTSTILFIGLIGIVRTSKNIVIAIMSIELLLLAANLNFAICSVYLDDMVGHAFVLFILALAAAESAVGLSILLAFYKLKSSIQIESMLWAFEEREKLIEFYERVFRAKMHAAYFRPGGVYSDIPEGLLRDMRIFINQFNIKLLEIEDLLNENRIWKQRLVDIGIFSAKEALDWGFSGVMSRGSGVNWDLRKSQPYEIDNKLNFSVPIDINRNYYVKERATRCRKKREKRIYATVTRIKKQFVYKDNEFYKLKIVLVVDNDLTCILSPRTRIALMEKVQAMTDNPMVRVTTHYTMYMGYLPLGSPILSGRFQYIIAEVSVTPDYNINDIYNVTRVETLLYDCQDLLDLDNIKSYVLDNRSSDNDFDVDSDGNNTGESDYFELPTDEFLNPDSDNNNKNFSLIQNIIRFYLECVVAWLFIQLYKKIWDQIRLFVVLCLELFS